MQNTISTSFTHTRSLIYTYLSACTHLHPRSNPSRSIYSFLKNNKKLYSTSNNSSSNSNNSNVDTDTTVIASNQFSYFKEQPRINPVGIQYLSKSLHKQLFGNNTPHNNNSNNDLTRDENNKLLKLAKLSLQNHDLLNKRTLITEPISFILPPLQGHSLDEHFQKLGHFMSHPYLSMALNKFKSLPPIPAKWLFQPGWTRYPIDPSDSIQSVPYPLENTLVFDTETMYNVSHYPIMATAVSSKAWYSWCSPYLCSSDSSFSYKHLIPLNSMNRDMLIIGHNVAFDRSKVLEEYNFTAPRAYYMDTRSLHIAITGLSSRQRPIYKKNEKLKKLKRNLKLRDSLSSSSSSSSYTDLEQSLMYELEDNPWISVSSLNSLSDVAYHYCNIEMDKTNRDYFSTTDKSSITENFQELMTYCATDVIATSKVFDAVFPMFLEKCPHPVSFGALKDLNNCILPLDHTRWQSYTNSAETLYQKSKIEIEQKIIQIIEDIVKLKDLPDQQFIETIQNDPWLSQLDWTIKPTKLTKRGVPYKNQKKPGYPEWYRSLFHNNTTTVPNITIKTRIIPILFKLSWEGFPVIWTTGSGWCFPIPNYLYDRFVQKNYVMADEQSQKLYQNQRMSSLNNNNNNINNSNNDYSNDITILMKIPNPRDRNLRSTTLLGKGYIHFFEKGILTSKSKLALEALNLNSSGSYWMSSRERIFDQHVVCKKDFDNQFNFQDSKNHNNNNTNINNNINNNNNLAVILPQLAPMGTVTRRAVEKTWLTASNAKKNRIGSELKTQVIAPDGYCFVGADVDSEELWIASLVGDSVFNIHGGTPIGWMCLEGTKAEGTDLHSKTASLLGCSRNEAKIFNYGRIYGAGVKFAGELLRQFNPALTENEAKQTALKLYENTKGKIKRSKMFKKYWYGGSESILFNKLEAIAEQENPMTPTLGCGITSTLLKKNLQTSSFLPSRINWAIQSSGVDYLHLLLCSMNYLIAKYNLNARLCITIHDEIRYLASEKDKYRVAMALQVSNIWTRAMFCEQMGINDLPQNCAFFSAIDIDKVLRKEVDMDCITPSNPMAIPPGESLNILQLLDKPEAQLLTSDENKLIDVSGFDFTPREPVFAQYNRAYSKDFLEYFLKMQLQRDSKQINKLENEYIKKTTERQFSRNKECKEYSLKDYLKDIQSGKKQKLPIMLPDGIPSSEDFVKQHSIAQKIDSSITNIRKEISIKGFDHIKSCNKRNYSINNTPTQPSTYYVDLHQRIINQ
ncbi:DNA-directed DNA polymerase gamma MIP1 PWA37_002393 [Arxiozyma heterogenica]|uniref:DNA-directed DNA polymerase gamma MIP1 n=1 Tax=Arxiozyma heterogenica TaxID=278026 RepID=UPI002F1F9046